MTTARDKYQLKYPHHMDWQRQLWVLKQGDVLQDAAGNRVHVSQITRSPIQNEPPRVVLSMEQTNATNLSPPHPPT